MQFRYATPADVDAVVALVESAYRGEASRVGWTTEADLLDGQRTDHAAVRELIDPPGSRVLLAFTSDGAAIACCHVARRPAGVAYFGMFAVAPRAQSGGIGSIVLAEAEHRARDDWSSTSMEMTVLTQRRDLIEWYERRGYACTGEQRAFPYGDERFGVPKRSDLRFDVLVKSLAA